MKYVVAFLLLATTAVAQTRIDFNPYNDDSRTIEYDLSSGQPVTVYDVTVPEGVGFIWMSNPVTKRVVVQYSRQPYYQQIRYLQSIPTPFPYYPFDYYGTQGR